VGAQPALEYRLRGDDDMRLRLDVFFVLAGVARFLSVLAEEGVKA